MSIAGKGGKGFGGNSSAGSMISPRGVITFRHRWHAKCLS